MLEHLVDALLAREQITLLLGGIGMMLLGGVFIADHVFWRLRAARYPGTLIGVREKAARGRSGNRVYFPVVEYMNETGERIIAETDSGSSTLADKIPGTRITLLIRKGRPLEGRILGHTGLVFGLIFIAIGTVVGCIALRDYDVTAWTFIIGVFLVACLAALGLWKLARLEQLETGQEFSARKYRERLERKRALPLLRMEDIRPRLRNMEARAARIAPVMGLAGLAMIGTGHWMAQDLYHLLLSGETASGRIIGYERVYQPTDRLHVYYPEVTFTTAAGRTVTFRDKLGSGASTTARKSGARVTVVYNANNPERAMIDRGWWNWAFPFGMLFIGVFVFLLALKTMKDRKRGRSE